MTLTTKRIATYFVLILLAGCGTTGMQEQVQANVAQAIDQAETIRAERDVKPIRTLQVESSPWIAPAAQRIDADQPLPAVFRTEARFVSAEKIPLHDIADTITRNYGVSIRLGRDVFHNNRTTQDDRDGDSGVDTGFGVPPAIALNFTGPLSRMLDTIADRSGTYWEYRNGSVIFSRLKTRTFQLKTMPGTSAFSATVGKTAQSGGGDGGGGSSTLNFGANSSISMSSSMDYWTELVQTVQSMLTQEGAVTASAMTNSITVTDLPQVVERIAHYIDAENRVLSRQVGLRVQVYSIALEETSRSGVDWNLVFNSAAGVNMALAGPTQVAGAEVGGAIGATVLRGRFRDSRLIVQSLSKQGQVATVIDTAVVTLNNQPAPVAVTDNRGYVSKTSITPGSLGSPGIASMEQEMLTTGFILNLLPTIMDNRSIMLQVQLDLSELKSLQQVTSDGSGPGGGGGDQPQATAARATVQTPFTSSIQTMQRASLKSGDTLVLSGFRRQRDRGEKSGVIDYEGGTKSAEQAQEEIVILISPELVEGV